MDRPRECAVPRRSFLRACGGLAVGSGLAGCTSEGGVEVVTPASDDEGNGGSTGGSDPRMVYIPSHVHDRAMAGTTTSGGYAFGLAYSQPDYYWTVDGRTVRQATSEDDANIQLMATVWAPDSRIVLPHVEVTATVEEDGEPIAETRLVPMLNQRWGLHYAANVGLERYSALVVRLSASPEDIRRTGGFRDEFGDPASVEIDLPFDRTEIQNLPTLYTREEGRAGAVVASTGGDIPIGRQPAPADLPGEVVATGSSAGATITVSAVPPEASPLEDGNPYLAVSATTPYNDIVLPRMRVEGRLGRGDETVYQGQFARTLDGVRGYHYGASVDSVEAGDELVLSFPTPPQIARYEGYETAFVNMSDLELAL